MISGQLGEDHLARKEDFSRNGRSYYFVCGGAGGKASSENISKTFPLDKGSVFRMRGQSLW